MNWILRGSQNLGENTSDEVAYRHCGSISFCDRRDRIGADAQSYRGQLPRDGQGGRRHGLGGDVSSPLHSTCRCSPGYRWAGGAGRGTGAPRTPARETWHAEPAKVADNLYFLGTKIHSAWALVGSQGIIVIEALFDYAARDEILDGLKKVGLDSKNVKYVILSHAHGDHDGGAVLLQDSIPNVHVIYGAEDWDAVDKRPSGKAKHDIVGTDGLKVSVGDASVQIVTMPGHTPGTLSYLFEVRDNGKPLRVAYVGGTAIPFNGTAAYYDGYSASSQKMANAAAAYGATALLTNHSEFDDAYFRSRAAANRKPGEPNPFDVGKDGVSRYFSVVQACTAAVRIRATGQ
ncbi:MAG: MBL fold metallo-hydrolase [Acidobacteriota bacterium]